VFKDWRALAERPRMADAAIIATPDHLHADPAVALAGKGYALLVEKPLAPTLAECERLVAAVKEAGVPCAVSHVLRYTPYTRAIKQLIAAGSLGQIVSIQHLEPVGYWHHAHSYVRGNWRREAEASFMLLTKSCHDLDWLSYIVEDRCRSVASFGSLQHFRREAKPPEAGGATRCLECLYERQCPYSTKKIYVDRVAQGDVGFPAHILHPSPSIENITDALRPYGRCVYECDNDVVDHQVVILQFEKGATAAFTMTAFNAMGGRRTRIFGTRGEATVTDASIEWYDFLTDARHVIPVVSNREGPLSGHWGGDYNLMDAFVTAVRSGDASGILSGPDATLESHRMVFAAERARREHRVVDLLDPTPSR